MYVYIFFIMIMLLSYYNWMYGIIDHILVLTMSFDDY
jgi:hypothetical protein